MNFSVHHLGFQEESTNYISTQLFSDDSNETFIIPFLRKSIIF
jgi:hypothetical protein